MHWEEQIQHSLPSSIKKEKKNLFFTQKPKALKIEFLCVFYKCFQEFRNFRIFAASSSSYSSSFSFLFSIKMFHVNTIYLFFILCNSFFCLKHGILYGNRFYFDSIKWASLVISDNRIAAREFETRLILLLLPPLHLILIPIQRLYELWTNLEWIFNENSGIVVTPLQSKGSEEGIHWKCVKKAIKRDGWNGIKWERKKAMFWNTDFGALKSVKSRKPLEMRKIKRERAEKEEERKGREREERLNSWRECGLK